jgi:hypothetical protein
VRDNIQERQCRKSRYRFKSNTCEDKQDVSPFWLMILNYTGGFSNIEFLVSVILIQIFKENGKLIKNETIRE